MNVILGAALGVAAVGGSLWLLFGRHVEPWRPSGPDPLTLDTPAAIAELLKLATEAQNVAQPDEVVRLMGRLFIELPPAELRPLVEGLSQDWLVATRPRMAPPTEAAMTAALAAAALAAEARDFAAGREQLRVVLGTLQTQAFGHPGAALVAAGMNGAWAREQFGAAAA